MKVLNTETSNMFNKVINLVEEYGDIMYKSGKRCGTKYDDSGNKFKEIMEEVYKLAVMADK
jgi:hypothetical protein